MTKFLKKFSEFKLTFKASKRLLGLLWEVDKGLFIGNLIVVSIPAIVPFINAYIYKIIIDLVISGVNGATFDFQRLYILVFARVGTLFIQDMSTSFQTYYEMLLWSKFPVHLYQIVLSKLANLDVQCFEDSAFKDRLEKVKDTFAWRPLNMLSSIFYTVQSLLQFLIALVAISQLNWIMVVAVLLVAIPTFVSQTDYAKISWGIWGDNSPYRKKFWYLSDLIQNGQSVKEIKIFQLASTFLSELKDITQKFVKDNTKIAVRQIKSSIVLNLFGTFVYIGIEVSIFLSAIAKKISIGDITYYTTVVSNFQNGVGGLFRNITQLFSQGLYVQDMFELLDVKSKIAEPINAIKIDDKSVPSIEFRNVNFSYPGTKQKVLDNFSILIEPGQKVAFVGENGAGKTTIIKLLARFYDVDEGEILIDGHNLKNLDLPSWYRCIGVLFQDFIRYEYSFKDNIRFGKIFDPENLEKIKEAANLSGADSVASHLEKGYDQMLGKTFDEGVDLSTGQWQKVALARGFLRDAPILILDEPTASIDAKAEAEIFDKVENLSKDKTVIIISHRFSTVRNANKIYVLGDGKVKESGTHKELMKLSGIYATLFNLQAQKYQ